MDKEHSCSSGHVVAKDPHKVVVQWELFSVPVEIDVEECDDNGSSYMKLTVSFLALLLEIITIPVFPARVVKEWDKLTSMPNRPDVV